MDSYDLFGEDGGGMLEGLPELGGVHLDAGRGGPGAGGAGGPPPPGAYGAPQPQPQAGAGGAYGAPPGAAQPQPGAYGAPPQDSGALQKLAAFGGAAAAAYDQQQYGGYDRPMGPPAAAAAAAAAAYGHRAPARQQYGGYGADAYGMNAADELAAQWGSQHGHAGYAAAAALRYGQAVGGYGRQPQAGGGYEPSKPPQQQQPQQQQYPPPMMQQPAYAAATAQQRHYAQPGAPQGYPGTAAQPYGGYAVHQRAPPHHHPQYAPQHQMEMQPQQPQYGQMGGHVGHPPQHHVGPYGQPHMQPQPQFAQQKPAAASPQYRAPFPQLSPQMSPRPPQMSPRPPQVSPRSVASPAKPNMSPHHLQQQQQPQQQSPRPTASHTPKQQQQPQYGQQTTLQALEQMVMPGTGDYQPYQQQQPQQQRQLAPPQMRQHMPEPQQQWPPPQQRPPPQQQQQQQHLGGMNGVGMMEQQMPPTSQPLPQMPPVSVATHLAPFDDKPPAPPPAQPQQTIADIPRDIRTPTPVELPRTAPAVSTQSDFAPQQSPTTSVPDKLPSSTTNSELAAPPTVPTVTSHPPTPTPTSTTDDNATGTQETGLPSNCDSAKQLDEMSDASSASNQQAPSQSGAANTFTDFNCVSSMSGYQSQPETPKTSKMDELVQSNMSMFSQDNSLSQESLAESNKSESSAAQSPRLQSPGFQSQNTSLPLTAVESKPLQGVNTPTPASPTQSHSLIQNQNSNSQQGNVFMSSTPSSQQFSQVLPNISQHLNSLQNQQQNSPGSASQNQQLMSNISAASIMSMNQNSNSLPGSHSSSLQSPINLPPNQGNLTDQQSVVSSQANQMIPTQLAPVQVQTPPSIPVGQQNIPPMQPQGGMATMSGLQQQNTQMGQNPMTQITQLPPTSQTGTMFEQGSAPNTQMMQMGGGRVMGMNPMGHPGMPIGIGMMSGMGMGMQETGFQQPISHQQERAALQQQLQELYCMPPGPEHQEKIMVLQERLNILSQHEATEQCNGGPQCVLQSPMFANPMIDSPQVTSTTGRGRGKGGNKPRKPRAKKGEKGMEAAQMSSPTVIPPMPGMPPQQLPVSEDFVTPGAGLTIPSSEMSEFTDVNTDILSGDINEKKRGRKPREPKKPKEPKQAKEPKEAKPPKEKKKKDKDEPRVKRKYVRKKKPGDGSEDNATDESFNKSSDSIDLQQSDQISENAEATPEKGQESIEPESSSLDDQPLKPPTEQEEESQEMQADSQTPAEDTAVPESSNQEEKRDEYTFDDQQIEEEMGELPKRPKKVRNPPKQKVVSTKTKGRGTGKRGRKKGAANESDGEGEDLLSTPPPSPPPEDDTSNKRRSARNTQRKKYIDDVMLRFSDDDTPAPPPRSRKAPVPEKPPMQSSAPATPAEDTVEDLGEGTSDTKKDSNYIYVNPAEEDSMVVQYVLASRMVQRKKPEKPEEITLEEKSVEKSETIKEDEDVENKEDEENKPEVKKESEEDKDDEKDDEDEEVEEFYVKYRNFSYLHCEWKTEEELYKGDRRIANKIKRFKQKQAQQLNIFENLEDEPFNPDYTEVDRVLDYSVHTDQQTGEVVKHYLVKWRALQYEDCTWELEEDVDPLKIQQYEKFNKIPPKEKWKSRKRPNPESWTKLEKSPIYKGANSLREYQLEGLNWLLFSWFNGRNCILADEMGLGKTIQSLTFINAVWEYGIRGPFLVIAPLSTIPNWQREIESWTDMNVIVYHGSATSRNMIQEYEMYYKSEKGQHVKDITKFNILITTFEIIVTDFADLKGFNWRLCVIDEAHRLKNRNCKLLEGLRQLSLEHRVLLSGTPLQNNVNELFSLLNFLEPQQFPSSDAFLAEFGGLKTEQEVSKLQCLLKPMMLRRLKEDVEKSLAPKEETVVEVELTNIQKKYYRGILERNFSFLSKGTTHANIPNLMNTMMELRKCCIHPYLLNGAEDQIQYDYKQQQGEDPDAYYKNLINSSGKMVLIDKLLPKLKANGHRVLIFSQMVKCLDILEDYLMYRKYPFERIDGRIRGNLRQAAIDRFSKPDSDRFVFLLCTKAGGLGINLTAADTVIIYDSDWNPQNDLQAQARCHRIGQQKMVKIYRLLCRNTYEREMFDKASLKLGLDKAVLQSMNTSQGDKGSGNRQLSKKEIEDLLKKGAYGALLDEENDGDKFCEEDIDVILARRTQVITMESEKGSTFSKASFASSANRSDIAIDDPDFWNKWAKKAEIDTTEKDESEDLVLSEPRRRTQIKRYGHDENPIDMSELESSSDSDMEGESLGLGMTRSRRNKLKKKRLRGEDYYPREGERGEIVYGSWARRECFMVERGLLTFGWGRWGEILQHSQLRKGWREQDVEDCARVILLYCLRFYRGDEKIRSFIWDLITPSENGEQKISRNHHGLKDPVPRGIRNKNKNKKPGQKDTRHAALTDPNHWSKNEKYDGDIFLESNYKKHLGRHANKVLLRVRMLYYIKHEIIGDLVQHIADGVHASALPIRPPPTEQPPAAWWDADCDRSLLVGTWRHGYENYVAMRRDPALCFLARCGPPPPGPATDDRRDVDGRPPATPTQTNDDDDLLDDDDTEQSSLKSRAEVASEGAEPSPGPSACSDPAPGEGDERDEAAGAGDDRGWPNATDLNTRLRRVITSYQRSYRREEQKMQASKAKQPMSAADAAALTPLAALAAAAQQMDARDAAAAAVGLQGWDLQQLALYLLMERQGKQAMEAAVRESSRERQMIGKRWTKREEADFFRVASSYGIIYYRKTKKYDWLKFKQLAKLDKKTDEELTEYYKHFVMMCKKQTGMNIEEGSYDTTIEHVNEEKARRTLERLELLSRIREEILTHPKLEERLKVCVTSADMPDWWVAGKHDKDLLLGVAKHGLGRTDYYLLNDPDLSFQDVLRKKVIADQMESKDAIKLESHEDILKFDKDEILVKLEKGEGTLKIEKVSVKKEGIEEVEKEKKEDDKVKLTIIKTEVCEEKKSKVEEEITEEVEEKPEETKEENKEDEVYKEETPEETEQKETKEPPEEDVEKPKPEKLEEPKEQPEPSKEEKAKKQAEIEADLCSKQAAELKAMFPDLEVIQPLSRLSQVDTFVLKDKQGSGALDFSETTVAQLFNNAVKWPKEYAIQVRLQHIIYAIETKEWPVNKNFSAYATGIGNEFDIPIHELPNEPPKRDTSTPMSVGDPEMGSLTPDRRKAEKRKRHIAIDVETERAKLHALLNSSHMGNPMKSHGMSWENDDSEDSRRSTPQSTLQPPPAHQHKASTLTMTAMPFDLKYSSHPSTLTTKTIGQTTVIPGTSSTLTPIDLSSSIQKSSGDIQNEVQDFSLKKSTSASSSSSSTTSTSKAGNKLDDTLSKLMKRKNCPEPEPLVGKEKKRRKLDEIVLGLSAAKEQSLFPDTTKKPTVTPSVTVTPTSAPSSSSCNVPPQKPFTITVTSVPPAGQSQSGRSSGSSGLPSGLLPTMPGKDSFSQFLAQAEQQNLLLKKQQQQRKSYEAMIADIGKVTSDFGSKQGGSSSAYSHEAKVNKWLAEQSAALAEQPLGVDYLSPRRRRPRVDPTLLDWKRLTGDENVSVVHKVTGKKLTGPKAPTLKSLGQWLTENPMYNIDPKWSDLVKERGNLSSDLHKRLPSQQPSGSKSKSSVPGRPPVLASPTGSTSSVSSANLPTSLPSSMSFASLSSSGLAGLNPGLLTGLSGLGQFDPKTNPLLLPFAAAGLPGVGSLGQVGGLGGLGNINLFANLAGMGLPGLGALDPGLLASAAAAAAGGTSKSSTKSSSTTSAAKQDKPQEAHASSKPSLSSSSSSSAAAAAAAAANSPFPFPFFPNPGLLYTPLGLGGLNPFTLQPGSGGGGAGSSPYDALAQQCGLLNGAGMGGGKSKGGGRAQASPGMPKSGGGRSSSNRDAQLAQQLLLPPDTQILESISKAAGSLDAALKQPKQPERRDERRRSETPRSSEAKRMQAAAAAGLPGLADFTRLLEAQGVSTTAGRRPSEQQAMREALEHFGRANSELVARALGSGGSVIGEEHLRPPPAGSTGSTSSGGNASSTASAKRPRESSESPLPLEKPQQSVEEDQPLPKKPKETLSEPPPTPPAVPTTPVPQQNEEGVDIEALLPSTVVTSAAATPEKQPPEGAADGVEKEEMAEEKREEISEKIEEQARVEAQKEEGKQEEQVQVLQQQAVTTAAEVPPKKGAKRRGKRKSGEIPIDPEAIIEKKNLRSSASRSAAAAAARQQREAENAQRESEGAS